MFVVVIFISVFTVQMLIFEFIIYLSMRLGTFRFRELLLIHLQSIFL